MLALPWFQHRPAVSKPIALSSRAKGREPRACLDRVGTGYRRIIELFDDPEPGALGEALNGVHVAAGKLLRVDTSLPSRQGRHISSAYATSVHRPTPFIDLKPAPPAPPLSGMRAYQQQVWAPGVNGINGKK